MDVYLNGQFLPGSQAAVSIQDRGFLYGDALFETLPIYHSMPFAWQRHRRRLEIGLRFLGINLHLGTPEWNGILRELIARNRLASGVLRITVSRGPGTRGYEPDPNAAATLVICPYPDPSPGVSSEWRLITASTPLCPEDPFLQFKTANKLPMVMAAGEATREGADAALLLNRYGRPVSASGANLFWIQNNGVTTAPTRDGALPGITREIIAELCRQNGIPFSESSLDLRAIPEVAGCFVTNSVIQIREVRRIDATPLPSSPLTRRLQTAYTNLIHSPDEFAEVGS